ncbi:DUF7882 family protein [Microbacterium xanthum]|uniref:DUF7882 family protein n=1 Tax=Microbacterium xanthum TaxID=3079794 RepID=UPI002AD26A0A|nr:MULTISPECIES: hypothetical protein [unclassified Microbacterium]MDZ8170828.1 hypothetical protein [Microbacterium sp. KSW-48]MDZ8201337.1 hypothetical protein [Microbacterium sp. SSW1-59]
MGRLYYANAVEPIELPDRLLAHVKVIVGTKLRRGESFTLSWKHAADQEEGRTTLWLQPSIPLRFVFESAEPEKLNQPILKHMAEMANSSAGLTVDLDEEIPEMEAPQAPTRMRPITSRTPVRARTTVAA